MSILGFLFKPKSYMADKNAKPVKLWKYTLTSHAQNRIVDETRKMDKFDVLDNLFTKPNGLSKIKTDELKRQSYNRVGKRITTSINPTNNKIVTCRPVSKQDIREFNLINVGGKGDKKKYVKRNSKKQVYGTGKGGS